MPEAMEVPMTEFKIRQRSCWDCAHHISLHRCELYGLVNDEEPCERFLLDEEVARSEAQAAQAEEDCR